MTIISRTARIEALARIIAAEKCKLITDPCGEKLPSNIWEQALPLARIIYELIEMLNYL